MSGVAAAIEVRDVAVGETRDLRTRVLRNHLPGLPATAPSDDLPGTWHLGAFREGRLVGVVSAFAQAAPGRDGEPAVRFRFMAVEPSEQGGGVGSALLRELSERARRAGAMLLWANGRDSSLGFYRRLGFTVVGDSFEDAVSHLPHHVVVIDL